MGLFSFFSESKDDKRKKIKNQIENAERAIKTYKSNIEGYKRQGSPAYLIDGAKKNILTQEKQIKRFKEEMEKL